MTSTTSLPTRCALLPTAAPSLQHDDQQLVDRMLERKETAWVEFHDRYGRLINRCITKVTRRFGGTMSEEDVDEIRATLLLQLLSDNMHKLRSYDPNRGSRFGTWIGMLSIRAAYDHLRGARREIERGFLAATEMASCECHDPFAVVDLKQRSEMLADMLRSFSAKDRQFATLYFDQELEAEEIANRMRISVKTVHSKKHKIRSRLERIVHRDRLAA